jgi:hypothetical protein
VFAQLHAEQPDNIEYNVVRPGDGARILGRYAGRIEPVPELAAFKEFGRDSASRAATARYR